MTKVKQHLEQRHRKDPEGFKTALKAYNSSGYKSFSIFVFGETATYVSKSLQAGSVIALLNPKVMKENKNAP